MEYLVSFNITHNKKLLNPSNAPILYYSNSNDIDKLTDEFQTNEDFMRYIDEVITTIEYGEAKITYFVFEIASEEYHEKIANLQDVYKLQPNQLMITKYIKEIFEYLYEYSHKNDKLDISECNNDIDIIMMIYDILKTKYSDRVSVTTIREYMRSQLKQKYKLSEQNTETILRYYDELIV